LLATIVVPARMTCACMSHSLSVCMSRKMSMQGVVSMSVLPSLVRTYLRLVAAVSTPPHVRRACGRHALLSMSSRLFRGAALHAPPARRLPGLGMRCAAPCKAAPRATRGARARRPMRWAPRWQLRWRRCTRMWPAAWPAAWPQSSTRQARPPSRAPVRRRTERGARFCSCSCEPARSRVVYALVRAKWLIGWEKAPKSP